MAHSFYQNLRYSACFSWCCWCASCCSGVAQISFGGMRKIIMVKFISFQFYVISNNYTQVAGPKWPWHRGWCQTCSIQFWRSGKVNITLDNCRLNFLFECILSWIFTSCFKFLLFFASEVGLTCIDYYVIPLLKFIIWNLVVSLQAKLWCVMETLSLFLFMFVVLLY